jgi:hypothetical protein
MARPYAYADIVFENDKTPAQILRLFLNMEDAQGNFRSIVLVGHTIESDLVVLQRCGVSPSTMANAKVCIDIVFMFPHQSGCRTDPMSLKKIRRAKAIRVESLHNAEHDPLYILQALLKKFGLHRALIRSDAYTSEGRPTEAAEQ